MGGQLYPENDAFIHRFGRVISMEDKTIMIMFGVACVSLLEVAAIVMNTDGQYLSLVVGAVVSLVGFMFGATVGHEKGYQQCLSEMKK